MRLAKRAHDGQRADDAGKTLALAQVPLRRCQRALERCGIGARHRQQWSADFRSLLRVSLGIAFAKRLFSSPVWSMMARKRS